MDFRLPSLTKASQACYLNNVDLYGTSHLSMQFLLGFCVTINVVLETSLLGETQPVETPEGDVFTAVFSSAFLIYNIRILNVSSCDICTNNATPFYQKPPSLIRISFLFEGF